MAWRPAPCGCRSRRYGGHEARHHTLRPTEAEITARLPNRLVRRAIRRSWLKLPDTWESSEWKLNTVRFGSIPASVLRVKSSKPCCGRACRSVLAREDPLRLSFRSTTIFAACSFPAGPPDSPVRAPGKFRAGPPPDLRWTRRICRASGPPLPAHLSSAAGDCPQAG